MCFVTEIYFRKGSINEVQRSIKKDPLMSKLEDWIVILDDDAASKYQLDVCLAVKPKIRGAIRCDDPDNEGAAVCEKVEAFPTWCYAPTNECFAGVRDSEEAILALTHITPGQGPPAVAETTVGSDAPSHPSAVSEAGSATE